MSSKKLWKIPLWSLPLFIAHGIEEYLTFNYSFDPTFVLMGNYLGISAQSSFLVFQLIWWLLLIVAIALVKKRILILSQLAVLSLSVVYLLELEHIVSAIKMGSYYSGLITAIPLIILGFFYWKELAKRFGILK